MGPGPAPAFSDLLTSDLRHNPFDFAREIPLAPKWLQELVESHESLPWQRRGYLREALLDQLTSKAGFAPMEATPIVAEEEQGDTVREFLDQQRSGWGARFAAVFEEIGIETKSDLREATEEEMMELDAKLGASGAGSFHLRQIQSAIARLRNEGNGTPLASPDTAAVNAVQQQSSAVSMESIQPWQTKKRYAALLSHHQAHESLPWQRRGYLREAMLDQLITAAGFEVAISAQAAA